MNAVEIEEAISQLADEAFDPAEFPYSFLLAFGNKETSIKRLRSGNTNKSDLEGVLQTNNIHIKVCEEGQVTQTLNALKESPATIRAKAKFVVATDGKYFQSENLNSGEVIVCDFPDFHNHFGFFLALAGISTVKEIRESAFDIKATGRLNKLYVELLKDNPDWDTEARRPEMNHFMARLIFCFFAEDTDIFLGEDLFTATIDQMSEKNSSNTHEIISEIFRSMNTKTENRKAEKIANWANGFPYVNGGLFSGSTDAPKFTRIAKSYLVHIGKLDWTKINPDIFGSMIQAVADDEERGSLGMHYTSVPNILKVLNPLFLDDLREQLQAAGYNKKKLKALRERISKIRVFDPACGSGNFLVIAYKELRAIEARINQFIGSPDRRTEMPLTNFRGIELRDFPAEIARLALIIAEYQCDVTYRGQKEALAAFLPLDAKNWITQGNALRLDWLTVCPPTSQKVDMRGEDLFMSPLEKAQIDFKNEGGETYICGNPPYLGSKNQSIEQKEDLARIFAGHTKSWKSLDYVAGWFQKAAEYSQFGKTASAFVSTNSISQGQQAVILWPLINQLSNEIYFAHQSFNWKNLASNNAGVTVVIIGFSNFSVSEKRIFSLGKTGETETRKVQNINAYLTAGANTFVVPQQRQVSGLPEFDRGNSPTDGSHLLLEKSELDALELSSGVKKHFIHPFIGSSELIRGQRRYCIWVDDKSIEWANSVPEFSNRFSLVKNFRLESSKLATQKAANWSHRFDERKPLPEEPVICVPITSSENREFLPADVLAAKTVVSNLAFSMPCQDLAVFGLVVSRLMLSWVAAVCARMRTDYRFTNTLCWNTFPVPKLTEKNKADLTRCAEDILLAREAHFPASIADLYKSDAMPENLRAAHERNDEVLERIYIGRRFRNDTERLEKLFELYTKMTTEVA